MSEHMGLSGKLNFWHMAYDDESGFAYCQYCKEVTEKIGVEFHEGWDSDLMIIRCKKCKSAIWTSKLDMERTEKNEKCFTCKKKISREDAEVISWRLGREDEERCYCSGKCHKKGEKDEET